jgi:hypothetical protein
MRQPVGSSPKCGEAMRTQRFTPSLLALSLCAAASHQAAPQWTVTAEVTAPRYWGGSSELEGGRSFRPYRPTVAGLGLERSIHGVSAGVQGYYASTSLALEGPEGVVAVKNALELYGVAAELSGNIRNLGEGGRLMLYGGPVVEVWSLAGEASHVRGGFAAAIGLQVAMGKRWSAVIRVGAAVSGSPFEADDLDAGFVPRMLWRREVSGRLRYRL